MTHDLDLIPRKHVGPRLRVAGSGGASSPDRERRRTLANLSDAEARRYGAYAELPRAQVRRVCADVRRELTRGGGR